MNAENSTVQRTVTFDVEEFLCRLIPIVGSTELARAMFDCQCRYEIALGLVTDADAVRQFGDLTWVRAFRAQFAITGRIFDPITVEEIIMETLGVGEDMARNYTDCEASYMRDRGLM